MSDYDKIAQAIQYIRHHADQQPSLETIAARVNLSAFHFQRLFSRWAGVTPKRFLQVLTLDRAKNVMRERQLSSLNTSIEVGLSSSSRLYDHFVQLEAVTPSQYRDGGLGLAIGYGCHRTPYGDVFIALTPRGICRLDFVDDRVADEPFNRLRQSWPNADIEARPGETGDIIDQLFSGNPRAEAPLSLWVRGTNFQISVWRALLNIQPGTVISYGELARELGQPKGARAVGSALGSNPVGLLIPCHRVIRQSGQLGGYRWGEIRKHAILAREAARGDEQSDVSSAKQ